MAQQNQLSYTGSLDKQTPTWIGDPTLLCRDFAKTKSILSDLSKPCFIVTDGTSLAVASTGDFGAVKPILSEGYNILAYAQPMALSQMGDPAFCQAHGVGATYFGGSMANAISSEEMVIAMGRQNLLCSFGAGGCVPSRIEEAILKIQAALPNGPYAFNLIHSPSEDALEKNAVDLFLKHGVKTIEASAYMALTPHVVRYRVQGLSQGPGGEVIINNKILAKISRKEVATRFMEPAPKKQLDLLLSQGLISQEQATLATKVPMADDITIEADSGGHTDNRPMVALLPVITALRDQIQAQRNYQTRIRVGAGGGIGTPDAALAAYAMGADYIVTGSINQSCVESGSSAHVRQLLSQADIQDVMMAPASDMFEMGVKLQVLKKGTLFPMRAQKLYDAYHAYDSLEQIPQELAATIQNQILQQSFAEVWQKTESFFNSRDPSQIEKARQDPKRKMALVFRWYLGLSSHWANQSEQGRQMDYQIWCGPAMGSFNDWVKGTYLEQPDNRKVVELAFHLTYGASHSFRMQELKAQGILLPPALSRYLPSPIGG